MLFSNPIKIILIYKNHVKTNRENNLLTEQNKLC